MDKILSMCKKGEFNELSNHLKDIPFGEVSRLFYRKLVDKWF